VGEARRKYTQFVVDGWYTLGANGSQAITLRNEGRPVELAVAPYVESPGDEGPLQRHRFDGHAFIGGVGYVSFNHVTNHLLGAYCSSLCVPKTSSTSCDQAVFVDRATDMSPSPDAVLVEVDRLRVAVSAARHRAGSGMALQDGELVAKDQDLCVLPRFLAPGQPQACC